MKFERQAAVVVLAASMIMAPGLAAAESAEEALRAADYHYLEHRQDLAALVSDGERFLAKASPGDERAIALVLIARALRLRGEFSAALARLGEADREAKGPMARVRALIERRWTEEDRHTLPWGEELGGADDLSCHGRDLSAEGEVYVDTLHATAHELPTSDMGLGIEAMALEQVQRQAEQSAIDQHIYSAASRVTWPVEGVATGLFDAFQKGIDVAGSFGKLAGIPETRVRAVNARLSALLLGRRGDVAAAARALRCDQLTVTEPADPSERASVALSCAEVDLFAGGRPEDLGHFVTGPGVGDTVYVAGSKLWQGIERVRQRRSAASGHAKEWLAIAESGYRLAGMKRGEARVAFVRAADELAEAIEAGTGRSLAADALRDAGERARAVHDGRLELVASTLESVAHALHGNRAAAQLAIGSLAANGTARGDVAALVGAARLLASVAQWQSFGRYEPISADILTDLAARLYSAANFELESSKLARTRARVLEAAGMLEDASAVLRTSAASLENACSRARDGVDSELGNVLFDRAFLLLDLDDDRLLARVQEKLEAVQLRLSRGETDLGKLATRVVETQAREKAAQQARFTAALRLMGIKDPVEHEQALLRARALRAEYNKAANEGYTAMAALGHFPDTIFFRLQSARRRDRADIVRNPDLPAPGRYASVARLASATTWRLAQRYLASALDRQGKHEEALRVMQAPRPGAEVVADAQKFLLQAGGESAQNVTRDQAADLHGDTNTYNDIHAAAQALDSLHGLEKLLGSSRWYEATQEPWIAMSAYVRALSGAGRHDEAIAMARDMIDRLESRRAELFDERFRQRFLGNTRTENPFRAAVAAAVAARRPAVAFELMERGKARSLQERIAAESSPAIRRVREQAQALLLLAQAVDEGGCANSADAPCTLLVAELARRQAEYDAGSAPLLGGTAPPAASAAEIGARLAPRTVLIDYFVTLDGVALVAFAAGRDPIVAMVDVLPEVLEGRVKRLAATLARRLDPLDPQRVAAERDASELSRILFPPPLRALMTSVNPRTLVLIPHAALHEVPFAYLPVEGRRLIERYILRNLPFAGGIARRKAPSQTSAARVLAYDGDDPGNLILHAAREAAEVASIYGVAPRMSPDRSTVLSSLEAPGIVHLIAHGSSAKGLSRIDLPRTSKADDGDLGVADIILHGTSLRADLVVLSSCELGLGARAPGDEGTGVPRALLQKGVRAVVAPLWQIRDGKPLIALMKELHRGLAGTTPAEALARMQRHAIKLGMDPVDWAGFVIMEAAP